MARPAERYKQEPKIGQPKIFLNNLIGGVGWGVGSVLGATVLIALIGLGISASRTVPFLGDITEAVLEQINEGQQAFRDQFQTEESLSSSQPSSYPDSYVLEITGSEID